MSPLTQVNGFRNNFVIKEYFHKIFNCTNRLEAKELLCECYEWAYQIKAVQIMKWIWNIMDDERLWNYFEYKVTTGLSEGINRAIKGLKWQAYGYVIFLSKNPPKGRMSQPSIYPEFDSSSRVKLVILSI